MENKILSISFVLTAIAILTLSLFNPLKVRGYYPNDVKRELSIDKKIRSIGDTQYFDNIESSRKTFFERDTIEFQIKIENIGNQTLNDIKVKDSLPKYLALVFYPGTLSTDKSTIEWTIDKLEAGQSKEYLIRAKIQNTTKIGGLTRQTNRVESKVENLSDSDNASYFIGKATVPATGASDIVLKTVMVTLMAGSGIYFRKKARGY
ncbi:MAG: hypothetical protein PHH12_02590 [Candidatus Shapirobacteria bacterium]|nr:hypothetical protein [Candidatus Shapirobacteria bacterium]